MKPLNARQQVELDALLQANSWTSRSVPQRIGLLLLVVTPTVVAVGLLAALVTPDWLVVAACLATFVLLVLSPYVWAPEGFIRWNFRVGSVSGADAAKWKGPGLP